jgi:hypothetical protein
VGAAHNVRNVEDVVEARNTLLVSQHRQDPFLLRVLAFLRVSERGELGWRRVAKSSSSLLDGDGALSTGSHDRAETGPRHPLAPRE